MSWVLPVLTVVGLLSVLGLIVWRERRLWTADRFGDSGEA